MNEDDLVIESCFVFSIIWSIGMSFIDHDQRKAFDQHLKQLIKGQTGRVGNVQSLSLKTAFDTGMIYDFYYDAQQNEWKHWMSDTNLTEMNTYPNNTSVHEIFVNTESTISLSYI